MDDDIAVERVLRSAREVVGEVMPGLERRRKWSTEEKLRILAQSVASGSSPALTCKMHGISSGQLYTWRKQFRHGALTGFVPVSITPEPVALSASEPLLALPPQPPAVEPAADLATSCLIEVELPSGVKLRIPGDADETSLRRILSALS